MDSGKDGLQSLREQHRRPDYVDLTRPLGDLCAGAAGSAQLDRLLAAQDRAVAACERRAAARDLARARAYLLLASQDQLTGTLHRWPGLSQLTRLVDQAHADAEPLVVAFLDVDDLKGVNDSRGHGAGDELLRAVGVALRKALRSSDVVVRYGGDEFVCALPQARLADALTRILDVRAALADALPDASISFGLAALEPGDTCEDVIARADQAMYATRRERRRIGESSS